MECIYLCGPHATHCRLLLLTRWSCESPVLRCCIVSAVALPSALNTSLQSLWLAINPCTQGCCSTQDGATSARQPLCAVQAPPLPPTLPNAGVYRRHGCAQGKSMHSGRRGMLGMMSSGRRVFLSPARGTQCLPVLLLYRPELASDAVPR